MHTQSHAQKCTHTCTHTHTRAHARTHMHMHACTHNTHTQTHTFEDKTKYYDIWIGKLIYVVKNCFIRIQVEELNGTKRKARPPVKQRYISFLVWVCTFSPGIVLAFSQCTSGFLPFLILTEGKI